MASARLHRLRLRRGLRPRPQSPSGSLAVARPASPCSAIAPHVLSWLASSPAASHGSSTGWPTSASHDFSTRCMATEVKIGVGGARQRRRVHQERVGLGAAEPAVGGDLGLEGGDLLPFGVVAGVDHQVGRRRVGVDLAHLLDGTGPEGRQRVVAGDLAGRQVAHAGASPSTSDPPSDATSTKPMWGWSASPGISAG